MIEYLKDLAAVHDEDGFPEDADKIRQAAAEIERLQIENQSLRDVFELNKKSPDELCLELTIISNKIKVLIKAKEAVAAAQAAKGT